MEVGEGVWEKIKEGFLEEGPVGAGAEARRMRNQPDNKTETLKKERA